VRKYRSEIERHMAKNKTTFDNRYSKLVHHVVWLSFQRQHFSNSRLPDIHIGMKATHERLDLKLDTFRWQLTGHACVQLDIDIENSMGCAGV